MTDDKPLEIMEGVREYVEGFEIELEKESNGRPCISALNQGGYDGVRIDLLDLLSWVKKHKPELLND